MIESNHHLDSSPRTFLRFDCACSPVAVVACSLQCRLVLSIDFAWGLLSAIATLNNHIGNRLLVHLILLVDIEQPQGGHLFGRTAEADDIAVLAQ